MNMDKQIIMMHEEKKNPKPKNYFRGSLRIKGKCTSRCLLHGPPFRVHCGAAIASEWSWQHGAAQSHECAHSAFGCDATHTQKEKIQGGKAD